MATTTKHRQKRGFESITPQQNRKLHALTQHRPQSEKHLYGMIENLIGIPSISALSKQEASLIINRMEKQTSAMWRQPPKMEGRSLIGKSSLPNLYYIRGIRYIAKDLGWDKDHLKNWLKKYMKTSSIRTLDAETARKAFIGLRKIQQFRNNKEDIP